MTFDDALLKTNEFQQRRKLRLQQVREQSKDIAKKIRHRAKVEKLRHVLNVDSKKEKEYFECQEKFVKRLEQIYRENLNNIGTAHRHVSENKQEDVIEKRDLSKIRGKEAAADLKRRKQEKLDEQKKLLDRKLKAREAANELSREKSSVAIKKFTKDTKHSEEEQDKNAHIDVVSEQNPDKTSDDQCALATNDMATQWELPKEPVIPTLTLPEDSSSIDNNTDKNKKLNLFALSEEMTLNMNEGLAKDSNQPSIKPSLTLVSEYLQNRTLRFRQPEITSRKKPPEDLQSIKQTILRTRAPKTDGTIFDTICHVLDEQVFPVPSWNFENNVGVQCHVQHTVPSNVLNYYHPPNITKIPQTGPRHSLSPNTLNNSKNCEKTGNIQKSFRSTESHDDLNKKSSVTVYNHSTRDSRSMPCGDSQFVYRDDKKDDDAYAKAFKVTSATNDLEGERLNKQQQDMRHKIAVKKQNVDKEYRETLSFLNSLPKDVNTSSNTAAYIDEEQQKIQRDRHQRKLQEEFKKLQKESCRHSCKHSRKKVIMSDRSRSKSPSNIENELRNKEFQYSWMPVPDSDCSLAIHTLPNTAKDKGNSVKFSQINSYHEYRSRHKHTPPTKDVSDKPPKRVVKTLVVEHNESTATDCNESYTPSETSSVGNLNLENGDKDCDGNRLSDVDGIVIYKILNSKKNKIAKERKPKGNKPSSINIKQNQSSELRNNTTTTQNGQDLREFVDNIQQDATLDQIKEGVYKAVNSNNGLTYKVTRVASGVEMCQTSLKWKSWWDNIETCYSDSLQRDNDTTIKANNNNVPKTCKCIGNLNKSKETVKEGGDNTDRTPKNINNGKIPLDQPSLATSSSYFKSDTNEKRNITNDAGFLRLIDEANQESSKFYIGASGFLKDNNYEVIIQLRKTESDSSETKSANVMQPVHSPQDEVFENNSVNKAHTSLDKNLVTSKESGICQEQAAFGDLEVQNCENYNEVKSTGNYESSLKAPEMKSKDTLNTCDKGVHTSFQNSSATPDHITKTGSVVKPATSTYTQTNFSSPISRPPLIHMSSSTSTAYMSPPDIILPRFLRQDYELTSEDLYDSSNSINNHSQQSKINENLHNSNAHCRHKHCDCAKRGAKTKVLPLNKRSNLSRSVCATPPNTCRSIYKCESKELQSHKISNLQHCHNHKNSVSPSQCETKGNKCKNSKRKTPIDTADSVNMTTLRNIIKVHSYSKLTKSQLDPVVKKYVNKLLTLNKEGLKAIEIINQDCSDVTTPSDSVINVPSNINKLNSVVENKISLEQIKNVLKSEIMKENLKSTHTISHKKNNNPTKIEYETMTQIPNKIMQPIGRKRSIHKVKSLNISKRVLKNNSPKLINSQHSTSNRVRNRKRRSLGINDHDSEGTVDDSNARKKYSSVLKKTTKNPKTFNSKKISRGQNCTNNIHAKIKNTIKEPNYCSRKKIFGTNNRATAPFSSDSDANDRMTSYVSSCKEPYNTSSKTNDIIESDIDYMKIAEDKLHNMEKIADLTEKCTKRLSNLAKVLEEVRRNKSLVYSQISSNEVSSGDNKSDASMYKDQIPRSKEFVDNDDILKSSTDTGRHDTNKKATFDFVELLKDIPKPDVLNSVSTSISTDTNTLQEKPSSNHEHASLKCRTRPPPALSRHLKHGQDIFVTPHELSTVVEVDSPMSVKAKNQSRHNINYHNKEKPIIDSELPYTDFSCTELNIDKNQNYLLKNQSYESRTNSSQNSKLQMMDMKQFDDIMLKPFISLQEYAKQYKIDRLEDGSIIEDALKEFPLNDVISNSENSLPDVMTELLKRNVINEPFKFDTTSNNNSTSLSSESTLSVLALSKGHKKKKFADVKSKHQKSLTETSETLSMSSNPDLENAFQKLGMGWASSTLKKTKERLALTSSSSTSSTSLRKFNIKSFNLEIPELATDSISSPISIKDDDKMSPPINADAKLKNAIQQTSPTNSMTVKEFLNNELAKKITFNNSKSKGAEDFVSLYETKMPEEIKNSKANNEDEHSVTSANSPNNNRARTSTPVQIFKSSTYRTSSSSNTSNGLFSNADDLSSVKGTSNSLRNHSTSDKEDLTIPSYSLKLKKSSDPSKSD